LKNDERDDLSKPNLLPYGIIPSAPAIQLPNVDLFKRNKSRTVQNHFETKFDEIKRRYEELLREVHINDLIYSAKYNFVPLVGKIYHLYQTNNGYILSLIEPDKWDKYPFIGSFRLASTDIWEKVT
jgi:hypothetical protein